MSDERLQFLDALYAWRDSIYELMSNSLYYYLREPLFSLNDALDPGWGVI